MATISIDIPDAAVDRVSAAIAVRTGNADPATNAAKRALVKQFLAACIKDAVRSVEAQAAAQAAAAAAEVAVS